MKCKLTMALLFVALLLSSCGSPKTVIRVANKADGTQTDITVKQGDGGATSVNVVPSISANVDTVQFKTMKYAD